MQPSVPRTAVAVGLPDRYRYWSGRSRRRYLFTRTLAASLGDYEDAVLLAVQAGEVVWVGESGQVARLRPGGARPCEFFVHLLAGTAEERRRTVNDLRPDGIVVALAA